MIFVGGVEGTIDFVRNTALGVWHPFVFLGGTTYRCRKS